MIFTEVILFAFIGCVLGIFTGIIPGIHVNTVSAVIISLLPALSGFSLLSIAAGILALSITHTFIDFIPSIVFGVPDADTALSVLPGHRLLLEGRALEALKLSGLGSFVALIFGALLFVPFLFGLEFLYGVLKPDLFYILLFISLASVLLEKRLLPAIFVFLIAGVFGIFSMKFHPAALFPALSGMFGLSTLLISLRESGGVPLQVRANVGMPTLTIIKNAVVGTVGGLFVSIFPGIGAAQATYLIRQFFKNSNMREFIVSVSGVNTANAIFTLVVLYVLGKTRSGAMVALREILTVISVEYLYVLLGVLLFAGGFALIVEFTLSNLIMKKVTGSKASTYKKIIWFVVFFVVLSVTLLSGLKGLFILATGCAIGFLPPLLGVRRSLCMSYLLLPVLLFYSNVGFL